MSQSVEQFIEAAIAVGQKAESAYPSLWEADAVPDALWREFAERRLFALSAPTEFGGEGKTIGEIARVGRALARAAGVQGLASVWLSHNMLADWILGHFANPAQQAEWWPRIASGKATLAFAVSEPGAGAHPKRLTTTATADGDGFRLNGRKAYVTNGPIAAVFAIVAIVSETEDGRKSYGAFLVPRDAPGLRILPSEHVDYLLPSGHASLALEDVYVPATARLANAADVYPTIVKPLRDHEDAAGAWTRLGAYERLSKAFAAEPETAVFAGGVAARLLAVEAMLEREGPDDLLAARAIFQDVAREVQAAVEADPAALGPGDAALARDLAKILGIARYAVDARFAAFGRRIA